MARSLSSDIRAIGARVRDFLAGAPGWVGGVLTGVQGAAISLLLVIAPATAALASAPSRDGSTAVDWGDSTDVAARLWLLAHGVPIDTSAATFTLIPLGLTIVTMAVIAGVSRRFAAKTWGSAGLAVATYAACAGLVSALTWGLGEEGRPLVVRAAIGAAIIATPAVAVGIWRQHGAEFGWVARIPHSVRTGLRLGIGTTAGALALAGLVGTAWAIAGRHAIADAASGLGIDGIGGVGLAATETAYVPTMVVWMLAWACGQGFVVGEGNLFSISEVGTEPLPMVPILGALPQSAGGWFVWAPVALALVGAVAWIPLRARLRRWAGAVAGAVGLLVIAGITGGLMALTAGSIGPGVLDKVGAEALPVALSVAGLAAAGMAGAAGLDALGRLLLARRRGAAPAPSPHQPAPEATPVA